MLAALAPAPAASAERRVVEVPAAGPAGSTVELRGTGFRGREPVVIRARGRRLARALADATGRFATAVRLPASNAGRIAIVSMGRHGHATNRFEVTDDPAGPQTNEVASASGATLRWTPSTVTAPASVAIKVLGLGRRAAVRLSWLGARAMRLRATRAGSLARALQVPDGVTGAVAGLVRAGRKRLPFAVVIRAPAAAPAPTPSPTSTPTPTPAPGPTPAALPPPEPGSPVIVAVGDIACSPQEPSFNGGNGTSSFCHQKATYELASQLSPTAVLALGDTQYGPLDPGVATLADFHGSYDLSWGKLKSITYPAAGNQHESYGGGGYYAYWGTRAGPAPYSPYSFDVGAWHIVSVPSACMDGNVDCTPGGRIDAWLMNDLATHANRCTLLFWHNPRWTTPTTYHQNYTPVDPFVRTAYAAGADVLLAADQHNYERFAPQDPSGRRDDARGLAEFVAGAGGKSIMPLAQAPITNSEAHDDQHYGVLKMTLGSTSFAWQYIAVGGAVMDSGRRGCH